MSRISSSRSGNIAIIGAGGHAREIANIALDSGKSSGETIEVQFVANGERFPHRAEELGIPILRGVEKTNLKGWRVIIGIGNGLIRYQFSAQYGERWEFSDALTHPTSVVMRDSSMGVGAVVFPHAVVSTNVRIGRHVHINSMASVSHDVTLADFTTVGPGARITGSVTVGECAEIGAGATILPGVTIGAYGRVGAGAVVLNDVEPGTVVAGVPAKALHTEVP